MGRPLTSAMRTSFQSSSLGFSTMAQPCRIGLPSFLFEQHEAIARLPDRVLDDVADAHVPLALAVEATADTAFFCVSCDRASVSRACLNSLSRTGLRKRTRCTSVSLTLRMPFGAPQIQHLDFDDAVLADLLLLLLDADDDAGDGAGLGRVALLQDDFDLLAAGLVEDGAEAGIAGEVDGEGLQRLLDGRLAVVADGADDAAAQVLQHHALEQVVDVLHREGQIDARGAFDAPFALEVADAAGVQDRLCHRQRWAGDLRSRRDGRRGTVSGGHVCRLQDQEAAERQRSSRPGRVTMYDA